MAGRSFAAMARLAGVLVATALLLGTAAGPAGAATFEVGDTGDAGDATPGNGTCATAGAVCTLRAAIQEANALPNSPAATPDKIDFEITGAGPHVIDFDADMDEVTAPVTIDGYSQTGAVENTATTGWNGTLKIVVDCDEFKGLIVSGGGTTIRGLVIHDAKGPATRLPMSTVDFYEQGDGLLLKTAGNNNIEGNFIGTTATGAYQDTFPDDERNRSNAIRVISGNDNLIGGVTPQKRNVLSGNGDFSGSEGEFGVRVSGGLRTVVAGNYVGTDPAGTAAVGNARGGIFVNGGFSGITDMPGGPIGDTVIGGTATGAGNLISGNAAEGLEFVDAGTGSKVLGNKIGTDVTGGAPLANNGQGGIRANGDDPVQIGDDTGHGNLISGNALFGLYLFGSGHTVEGNRIGTNATGTDDLANGGNGIQIPGSEITIGGTTPGAGNVISGNGGWGISADISDDGLVQGNLIGTNGTGTAPIANGSGGVILQGGSRNTIGGGEQNSDNVISGNAGPGVLLVHPGEGSSPVDNEVLGNWIGTADDGTTSIPNGGPGVRVHNGGRNVIGRPAEGNTIANNPGDGVLVTGQPGEFGSDVFVNDGNSIRGNSIFANGQLGIDLGADNDDFAQEGDGVTAGDGPGDGDSGGNELQNFPVLYGALPGSSTVLTGTLESRPSTTFTLDFYEVSTCDPSDHGEGATHLGAAEVTTNANGSAVWTHTVTATVPTDRFVTATATAADGTSEFARCRRSGTADPLPAAPVQAQPQTTTTQEPEPQAAGPQCGDKRPPITTMRKAGVRLTGSRRSRKLVLTGRSADHRECPSGVQRVDVSLARVQGRTGVNCRFIRKQNRYTLTGRKNCRRPTLFRATGTGRFEFTFDVPLKPGLYRAQARGTDNARNKETPNARRNIVFFSVK